jgi:2,4-dienoyl-CoA reductase-like NADH-dependent reductase (Old Yellow Enzyme family)
MPPMATGLATSKGSVTKNLIKHYSKRSKSLGLLIIEHSYVSLNGKLSERQPGIHDDSLVFGLEQLSSSIHATGTPVVIQINHAGRRANKEITGMQPVAPSPAEDVRQLSIKEIEELVDTYGNAAERAMKSGFDGVEVHGAHGFLINQFYSPLTNKRKDGYGGSLENRMKFPLKVVRKVKRKIGGRLLLYRMGSDDLDPKGTTIEDSEIFALKLEDLGVDIIDVSGGLCGSSPADLQSTQGYFIPQAEKIKKVVNIPVIGVGGIKDPEYANKVINEEKVDLVAIGRKLLNDPSWASQAIKKLSPKFL